LSNGVFAANGIELRTVHGWASLDISLTAPAVALKHVRLHWDCKLPDEGWKYLGDAWERAYGDLEWKPLDGRRVLPWYFLASNGQLTHGYGVKTGPAAVCGWFAGPDGVTLDMDVRNGGCGVQLGNRRLEVCAIVERAGKPGESAFAAAQALCRQMCPHPRLPEQPVYGFNDWYCDYGQNSADSVRYYAAYVARLAPKNGPRPFMVIDDGWQTRIPTNGTGGPWDCGNDKFPSMRGLADDIKKAGARPGIWIRLLTAQHQPTQWRLSRDQQFLDPSVPAVREYVKERVARLKGWGFELIKHDYSTRDLLGSYRLAAAPEADTWHFADSSRTTAEIIRDFYLSIREAAGDDTLVMGCQTVSHLSAGVFELMRVGDDTSGSQWKRVRTMGVNALAFRAPQHRAFYFADADCVGLTEPGKIPWSLNRQWLDLLARSGTPLFISFKRNALTAGQEREVAAALALAAKRQPLGEPLDWMQSRQPVQWRLGPGEKTFEWNDQPNHVAGPSR
jgi:alpha-galactosidase